MSGDRATPVQAGEEGVATEHVVGDLDARDTVAVASAGTTNTIHYGEGSRLGLNGGEGTEPVSSGMHAGTGTQPFTEGSIPDSIKLDELRAKMRAEQAASSASYRAFCLGPGAQPRGNITGLDVVQRQNEADEEARRERRAAAAKSSK